MRTRTAAAVSVALGAATWGTTGTAQALADLDASPAVVGAVRVVAGAVVLMVVAGVTGARPRVMRGVATGPLLVAGLAVAAYQVLFFAGVARAGVAVGTVVGIGSVPVLTGIVAWLADRTVPSRAWWLATLLAVAGCALVLAPDGEVRVDALGITLALGAGLAYAVVTVAGRRVLDAGMPPVTAMAAMFAVGAVPGLAVLVSSDTSGLLTGRGVVMTVWLAVVTVAVGYVLYARGLKDLPPPAVGTMTLAEPLIAAVLGVAVLGERPSKFAAAGAALLAVGLVLVARSPEAT